MNTMDEVPEHYVDIPVTVTGQSSSGIPVTDQSSSDIPVTRLSSSGRTVTGQSSPGTTDLRQPVTSVCRKIHLAVLRGRWKEANYIYTSFRDEVKYDSIITRRNETVLHIAVTVPKDNLKFVKHVVANMSDEALEMRDNPGNTAFFVATIAGKIEFAKVMFERKPDLAMIRGEKGELPLYMAASRAYSEMARWLYEETESKLEQEDKIKIFVALISSNIYDVALQMKDKDDGTLATARGPSGESALSALAKKRSLSTWDLSHLLDFHLLYIKHDLKQYLRLRYAPLLLVNSILTDSQLSDEPKILDIIDWETISIAVENGNADLLKELIDFYPDHLLSLQSKDQNCYTIFHLAVQHRQEDIFRLIHQFYSIKEKITSHIDTERNNMLHLAAKLPITSNRLPAASGPALQMQLELLWYKEVEKVDPFMFRSETNREGRTPEQELMESHKDLLKEAEKWMRGTADKCMLVATLVATVVFGAAFQLPGGVTGKGDPNFQEKPAFRVFFMADALSLVSSVASVMIFLGLMTSKYQIHEFHKSLPSKLIIGLVFLFISLASMLVAFVATTHLVFKKGEKNQLHGIGLIWYRFAIPIAVAGAVPIILFIWMHFRLFMDA